MEKGGHHISSVTPTGERFVDSNGEPSEKVSRAPFHIGGQFVTAAAFVSDAVTVGDRLTINAGLRFEHNRAISQDLHAVDLDGRETSEIVRGLGTLYTWNVFSPAWGSRRGSAPAAARLCEQATVAFIRACSPWNSTNSIRVGPRPQRPASRPDKSSG